MASGQVLFISCITRLISTRDYAVQLCASSFSAITYRGPIARQIGHQQCLVEMKKTRLRRRRADLRCKPNMRIRLARDAHQA